MEHTTGHSAYSGGRKLNSYSELPARGSPSCSPSQKVIMMWFVLFTTHEARQVLAGTRNETYIREQSDLVPVWNQTKYREELKCKDFHGRDDRMSELFFYWPEDNPLFRYCCKYSGIRELKSSEGTVFTYSEYGPMLQYAKYRDVGYFDQCLPFWKCRKTYRDLLQTQLYEAHCEKTDLEKLYWERFWKLIVWKYSLQQTILPLLPILESAVLLLALTIFPFTWRIASVNRANTFGWKDLVPAGKIWLKSIWRRLLMDWGHMYLLVMVGNGLFEAMRRQYVYSMQSKLFFAYSMLYFGLFVILACTSVVQQLAHWIGSTTELKVRKNFSGDGAQSPVDKEADNVIPKHCEADLARQNSHIERSRVSFATSEYNKSPFGHDAVELAEVQSIHLGDASNDKCKSQAETGINIYEQRMLEGTRHGHTIISTPRSSLERLMSCFCFKKRSGLSKKLLKKNLKESFRNHLSVEVFKLGDDYKWQPIATQATILFTLGVLLTMSIDNDEETSDVFGLLLGFFVQAGCLWSGIYCVVVFFQRAAYICKFLMKLRNR